MDPNSSEADTIHVGDCTPQLELHPATSIATNGRIPISENEQTASGNRKFQPDNRNGCEKYDGSDDDK